jgi:hypothetical protein
MWAPLWRKNNFLVQFGAVLAKRIPLLDGSPRRRDGKAGLFIPDWRWLLDRDDSPWYPTARLFRQDGTRKWDKVIARVHAALHDFLVT